MSDDKHITKIDFEIWNLYLHGYILISKHKLCILKQIKKIPH